MTRIESVFAWEALDSRGNPTVACEVRLVGGARGTAIVPSGASTGRHEAVELRDGGDRYGGRGVRHAVRTVVEVLRPAVAGLDARDQRTLDDALRACDGTPDLGRLGANAVLAVSIASSLAAADASGEPYYRWLCGGAEPLVPMPMVNIVSGGAHAGGAVDVQDVLVVPVAAQSFSEAIEWCWRARRGTVEAAERRGLGAALVADEGGLGPQLPSNRAAIELVAEGIAGAGLTQRCAIAVDVAATQLWDGSVYSFRTDGRRYTSDELVAEVESWCRDFAIVSVEDPLADDDWTGWAQASATLKTQLVGDDLFATSLVRLERGIAGGIANAVLVKPNQAGTLSGAGDVLSRAREAGYATVVSARSGETEDAWLADLAVGWRAGQIKVGSLMRSERTAKWNRLLRIEAEERFPFAGWTNGTV